VNVVLGFGDDEMVAEVGALGIFYAFIQFERICLPVGVMMLSG